LFLLFDKKKGAKGIEKKAKAKAERKGGPFLFNNDGFRRVRTGGVRLLPE
jgi:hypothetical protein